MRLPEIVAQTPIGKTVPVEVIRNGKHVTLEVKIAELKRRQVASAKGEEPGANWGIQVQALTPEIASSSTSNPTRAW